MSFNRALLVGRVKRGIDLGESRYAINVETDEGYADRDGNWVDRKESIRVVAASKEATDAMQAMTIGRLIYVEGRNSRRIVENENGTRDYLMEVQAFKVEFLDKAEGEA